MLYIVAVILLIVSVWYGVQGWTYAFEACKTNFLDCYFLDHSPCPKIRYNLLEKDNQKALNISRLRMPKPAHAFETSPSWWQRAMGRPKHRPINAIPAHSIKDLANEATPSRMVFYSYFFRPNYFVRQQIMQRLKEFNLVGTCAAMHVRRGDVVLHQVYTLFSIFDLFFNQLHLFVCATFFAFFDSCSDKLGFTYLFMLMFEQHKSI